MTRYPIKERILSFLMNFPFGFYSSVYRATHVDMVKSFYPNYKKISLKDFGAIFNNVSWNADEHHLNSLFTSDQKSEIHASIVAVNNIGYILSSYGLCRVKGMAKNKAKQLRTA